MDRVTVVFNDGSSKSFLCESYQHQKDLVMKLHDGSTIKYCEDQFKKTVIEKNSKPETSEKSEAINEGVVK